MRLKHLPVLAVMLVLCGCWNGKSQFHQYMAEGRDRHVPLIIYDISANDPHHLYPEPVGVAFINTQDQEISSVVLTVATCDIKGSHPRTLTLNLGGPFEPDASFMINPVSEPGANGDRYHMELTHMLITAIQVVDASGTRVFEGKEQVAKLVDHRVANYCVAGL